MSTTLTDAAGAGSSPLSSPSPPPPSFTPGSSSLYLFILQSDSACTAATPASLFVIPPITLASLPLSAPGPIISLPAPTLEPCPIPTSPFKFVFSNSITTSSTSTTSESLTTAAVGESTAVLVYFSTSFYFSFFCLSFPTSINSRCPFRSLMTSNLP